MIRVTIWNEYGEDQRNEYCQNIYPGGIHAFLKEKLAEDGFSTMLTDVIVLNINHEAGSLQGLLTLLSDNGINVEYMYGLSIDGDEAYVVLKTSDMAKADEVLVNNGVKTLSCGEIAKL